MDALLFVGAFFFVVVVLGLRRARTAWRGRGLVEHRVVADFDAVDAAVARARCACGRSLDKDGEGPRGEGRWGVEMSCPCGQRRRLLFVVGN